MRIFSIHKSKSKKQVSEKTPKLAAQKFLEKRKVGTVIYLHEHPSGKIHGPYQKDYDKKIMKGGFDLTRDDFKISENPPLLEGTNQLIIKEEKRSSFLHGIIREPMLFFGPKDFNIGGHDNYYKYVVFNKLRHMRRQTTKNIFITGLIECQEITATGIIVGKIMSDIEPQILLGLYYQYIKRCEQDYPSLKLSSNVLNSNLTWYNGLYMKRLFLYLLLYVLPKLNLYVLGILQRKNTNQTEKEKEYYSHIFNYVTDIDIDRLLNLFITLYDMPQQFKKEIMDGYLTSKQANANANANANMVENATRLSVISRNIESGLEQPQQLQQSSSGSGAITTNIPHPVAIIPFIPFIVIGGVLYGSFFLGKAIIQKIKKHRNRRN